VETCCLMEGAAGARARYSYGKQAEVVSKLFKLNEERWCSWWKIHQTESMCVTILR